MEAIYLWPRIRSIELRLTSTNVRNKMASRWRTWDKGYALDILNDPQPLNETVERAALTFGRGKININLSECSLPVFEPAAGNLTSVSTLLTSSNIHGKYIGLGRGRGRRSKFIEAQGSLSQDFPEERPRFPGVSGVGTGFCRTVPTQVGKFANCTPK